MQLKWLQQHFFFNKISRWSKAEILKDFQDHEYFMVIVRVLISRCLIASYVLPTCLEHSITGNLTFWFHKRKFNFLVSFIIIDWQFFYFDFVVHFVSITRDNKTIIFSWNRTLVQYFWLFCVKRISCPFKGEENDNNIFFYRFQNL